MANMWLRLWHDMPNDPKWRTIARLSGKPITLVMSVYMHMLVDASRNVTRGHVDVTIEDLASALDVTEGDISAVLNAMEGRVVENGALSGWAARQPKREDVGDEETGVLSPAQRKKAQREREKAAAESRSVSRNVTQSHAESRNVTTDKDKEEDKEKNKHTPTISAGNVTNITQGCVSADNLKPNTETPKPSTPENKVCNALALAGMPDVSPQHPDVLALIEKGVSPDQFFSAAQTAVKGGKSFNFAVGILKNQLRDAGAIAGLPGMPAAAWDADPQSVAAMAERLGVKPWQQATSENAFKGEAYPVFLMRVSAAYHAANEVAA